MKAVLVIDMLEDFFRDGLLNAIRENLTRDVNWSVKTEGVFL